ncbi:MAG TPA: NAD(P)/FAD-dependent oxidoreductase [Chitinophagaceae bacterium]|nr:NAD(P)/FAD-dependent oxidoreductase [Chitinophagaceae bacterium]
MKVVIVGAGFGGLRLARKLNNKPGFEVLLIDRFNFHQFQPLFYQVATAGLDASNISFPLRKVFHKSKNVRIRLAEVKEINEKANILITQEEEISYDILVIATGAGTNFFGNEKIATHAFPMKTTVEALQLRYRILQNFEKALTVRDASELAKLMNIVVVGGGPTGVEVSGALAEMKKYVLPRDYPELDFSKMNIYLLEGSNRLLSAMSEKSSKQAKKYLERLGVTVLTDTLVKDFDGAAVALQNSNQIDSSIVIWAAGIKGNILNGLSNDLIVKGNRLITNRHCKLKNAENIYAIGDIAFMETPKYPNGHPQVAPVAIQQADVLAHNLRLMERKSDMSGLYEFEYRDKGAMATVGKNLAVVDIPKPKLHFGGFLAWMIWMSLHLMLILGVKNRFFIFINWLDNYITRDQNLRLIFRDRRPGKTT